MTQFQNIDPLVEADDEWPDIPLENATVTFGVGIEANLLSEVFDLATVTIGRFGVDQLDVIIQDEDDPERRWMVREGALYDISERGLRYAEGKAEALDPEHDTAPCVEKGEHIITQRHPQAECPAHDPDA